MRHQSAIVLAAANCKATPAANVFRTGIVRRRVRYPENWPPPLTFTARDDRLSGDRVEGIDRRMIDQGD